MSGAPKHSWPPKDGWRTVEEISDWLGVTRSWALPRIQAGKWQPETRSDPRWPTRGRRCYSPACQIALKRQRDKYPPIGDWYALARAAEELGCNKVWIIKRMGKPEYRLPKLAKRTDTNGHVTYALSPNAFLKLQRLRDEFAPVSLGTCSEIARRTGRHPKTVRRRLKQGKSAGSYLTDHGRSSGHYDLSDALTLVEADSYPPAGDWLTAYRMATVLGRDYKWVTVRLRRPRYDQLKQMRLDDNARPRWHWPPLVFNELKLESNSLRDLAPCARGPISVLSSVPGLCAANKSTRRFTTPH
ncbi:MAG TPA: hypothetical protein VGH44_01190 [Candidatus Saccharimonadia bacterium]|jgi:hypothetical protein